jgi:hypothetical protein
MAFHDLVDGPGDSRGCFRGKTGGIDPEPFSIARFK